MGLAFQVISKMKGRMDLKDKDVTCTNYGKSEHEAIDCFQFVEHPDWWGARPRVEGKSHFISYVK